MTDQSPFDRLKAMTSARVALGKAGGSITTQEVLDFRRDHALARDAVWAELDCNEITRQLKGMDIDAIIGVSQARDRETYIKRPDLGRKLANESIEELRKKVAREFDVSFTIADGLSALAIERHAIPLMERLVPNLKVHSIAPVVVLKHGRVAISDEVGALCRSKLAVILIGERPGLSAPDSLGIYLTYKPYPGKYR